jgi:TolB-like protein
MTSIIEGYNYDIFISYRQKDNKGDRWVSEFVEALKTEIESTFKEEISVYFDINPHDGLLETHDVDASLKDKLKCLIFIPIISQTYCDSKSFAWQHEFVAFNKMAKEDQFGRDIRLAGGNVASRILPIKINDLDPEDKTLLENEIGGVLRSIEFIYKSAGVNRPLRANEDHPQDNLNKTYYRDQINKMANSVKEIITALRKHNQHEGEVRKDIVITRPEAHKNPITKIIIASFLVLILILLGYFLIPKLTRPKEQIEKSIAVLPFINDSPNDSTTYFINGIMEEVLNNLQKIKDFRVLSRTSTDQYRDKVRPTIPEIGKKLKVNYLVEGSGQKYGSKFVLRVQLIAVNNERHIWGKSYDREILQTSDIINIQSEIAQAIAAELNAVITPEEKQLIEKTPTTSLTANDLYQRGREELENFILNNNREALKRSEDLYHKALKNDPKFAQAYTGLALVFWNKPLGKEYLSVNLLDSIPILCDIALSYDNKLSEAYTLKGAYDNEMGNREQAIVELDKAVKYNPNDWQAFFVRGNVYSGYDDVKSLENNYKALSLYNGSLLPFILANVASNYFEAGFIEKSKYYYQEKLKLDDDTLNYYYSLAWNEFYLANFTKSLEYAQKGYSIDSTNTGILESLGDNLSYLGQNKEALYYYKKWFEMLKNQGGIALNNTHRIAYAYWKNGFKKESDYYFDEQIKNCYRSIELKREYAQSLFAYYDLAGVYAFRGEKDKTYENLRIFDQIKTVELWIVMLIKTDPLFNSIRNEPEFQQIVKDIESKYQAEHERVRKWLQENKML